MESIRLICFGESKENLDKAIKYSVIGTKTKISFDKNGEQLYFVLKENGEWKVFARAISGMQTDLYPFDDGYSYYTFEVTSVERCQPFGIREIMREYLGVYYGLKLQQPSRIEIHGFISEVERLFKANELNKVKK